MRYLIIILFICTITYTDAEAPYINKGEIEEYILLPEIEVTVNPKHLINSFEFLDSQLVIKINRVIRKCEKKGITLKVLETYRTPERQDYLKTKGRTTLSGGKSKHQHDKAVDIVPIVNNKYEWYDMELWEKIGNIGEEEGLIWGGRWKFKDYPHFEIQ